MSTIGSIMDQAGVEMRAAIPALKASNVERGIRQGTTLGDGEFPHVFLHSASDTVEVLAWRQERRTLVFFADLWTNDGDQEALYLLAESVKTEIRSTEAKRTLGSLVENTFLDLEVFETPDKAQKVARVEFQTTRIEM